MTLGKRNLAGAVLALTVTVAVDPAAEMNRYGAQGWELVFVGLAEQLPLNGSTPVISVPKRLMIFKKRG